MSVLQLNELSCGKSGAPIISRVDTAIDTGDIIALQGRSGSGKTTLLKCIAHLNLYEGTILYRGKTPHSLGIPYYRKRVSYVPQRPPILLGTPHDFLRALLSLNVRVKGAVSPSLTTQNILDLGATWGLDERLWDREWVTLSGGESQRIALATALGLNTAEVLLLDEPTSALDPKSSAAVEETILSEVRSDVSTLKAVVWITHSEEQASRVGTRFIEIVDGTVREQSILPV